MPIGLPARIGPGGRGPERAVRPLLGGRQSSVFPVPSREAIYAPTYRDACRVALLTSDPPRSVQVTTFQRGYDPRFTDPLGRTYMLRAGYKFF